MAIDVIMPQMGESIAEGTVTKWYKAVGERVERDEPLFEISTDKVDTEIPSPSSGILSEIKVGEGETVPVNTVVAVIGGEAIEAGSPKSKISPAEAAGDLPEIAAEATVARETPPPPASQATLGAGAELSDAEAIASAASEGRDRGIRSSPIVRRMAREHGIDLSQITGTGRGGRITREDILNHLDNEGAVLAQEGKSPEKVEEPEVAEGSSPPPQTLPDVEVQQPVEEGPVAPAPVPVTEPAPGPAPAGRVPMSVMRKSIAEHMIVSRRTSAHVTTVFEADVSRIVRLREGYKKRFLKDENIKLTFTPFFIRAVIGGLKAFPVLNASIDGDDVIYKKEINIGMAVALEWGLIVPVIRNADERSFLGLAKAVLDLAERARRKKLNPDDVQGGTFTLTNPGPYGSLFGTPIISQPQVAILGLGSIHKRPVVVHDAIAIRSMVYLALSFDHRLIDGAVADQFMAEVKRRLESWDEKIL